MPSWLSIRPTYFCQSALSHPTTLAPQTNPFLCLSCFFCFFVALHDHKAMIKTLKRKVLVPLLYQSGIPFRSWKAGQQNVILNYHGVIAEPFARINNRHVSAAQFEQDLRFYHKHFDVVSLADIFAHPAGPGSKGRPKLAVTFDDGFENNLTTALPLLEKYACPATIFVMSANLAEPDFLNWADLVEVLYASGKHPRLELLGRTFVQRDGSYHSADAPAESIGDFIKNQGKDRLAPLAALKQLALADKALMDRYRSSIRLMDGQQLRTLATSQYVEIGSHSRYHFNLGRVSVELAEEELRTSKADLEAHLQAEVSSFAYPDGDYSPATLDLAARLGYPRQLSVMPKEEADRQDTRVRHRFSYSNSTTHASNMVRLGFSWRKFSF